MRAILKAGRTRYGSNAYTWRLRRSLLLITLSQVNEGLLSTAEDVFQTSAQPSAPGRTFAPDFGSRKMEKEMEILDMPVRSLPAAWETCIRNAMSIKLSIEDELTRSRNMNVS